MIIYGFHDADVAASCHRSMGLGSLHLETADSEGEDEARRVPPTEQVTMKSGENLNSGMGSAQVKENFE